VLKSLGHVHRVVERRNTIPDPRQRADQGGEIEARLQGDRPRSRDRDHRAEVGPGAATTVPAHMFYEIVRKLPEGAQIVLEASGDRAVLAIRAGRSRFTLQTLPGERLSPISRPAR
jgi:DNA polymerase-3 subunit beta